MTLGDLTPAGSTRWAEPTPRVGPSSGGQRLPDDPQAASACQTMEETALTVSMPYCSDGLPSVRTAIR